MPHRWSCAESARGPAAINRNRPQGHHSKQLRRPSPTAGAFSLDSHRKQHSGILQQSQTVEAGEADGGLAGLPGLLNAGQKRSRQQGSTKK